MYAIRSYYGMKPAQAAKIFDSLDMDILLPVISSMKERKSSAILALMNPDKARTVTTKLAVEYELPGQPGAENNAKNAKK